jgi:hypothetical protein
VLRLPSPSTIIASAALFISLGGTGYAVTKLPSSSVKSATIKNGSIQARDLASNIRPGAKTGRVLRQSITQVVTDPATGLLITVKSEKGDKGDKGDPVPGPSGGPGPQGSNGPQGPVRYGGFVTADGNIEHLQGTAKPRVTIGTSGVGYCITMESDGRPHSVNATLNLDGGFTSDMATSIFAGEPVGCPAGTTWRVLPTRMIGGTPQPAQAAFYLTIS